MSFFHVVGAVQDGCKGCHFNELRMRTVIRGLELMQADYLCKPSLPGMAEAVEGRFILGQLVFPDRFEHLLQFVRYYFPGIPFQEVFLGTDPGGYLVISR